MANRIITIGNLQARLETVVRANSGDWQIPLRLSLRGGSGQITRIDIDCTTGHLQIDDDGTIIIDVRGRLGEEAAHG